MIFLIKNIGLTILFVLLFIIGFVLLVTLLFMAVSMLVYTIGTVLSVLFDKED